MNQGATRKDIDEVIGIMKDFMSQVAGQFDEVNKRLDQIDQKYDHLINTIDSFVGRIDKYETELTARDNHSKDSLHGHEKYLKKPAYL